MIIKRIGTNVRKDMGLAMFIGYLGHPKYTIYLTESHLGE